MRSLTFDEMDAVSGGATTMDDIIVVSALRIQSFYGGASLTSGTSGGVAGFSSFGGLDLGSLSALQSNDWDGDGTINDADEEPLNPDNNTIVVTAETNPVAADVANFVQTNWASLISAIAAKYGAAAPFRATLGGGVAGTASASTAGDIAFTIVDSYMQSVERNSEFYSEYRYGMNINTAIQ